MEKLILLILVAFSLSFGSREKGLFITYRKDKSVKDLNLSIDQAVFKFTFEGILDDQKNRSITYSIDGREFNEKLFENNTLVVETNPGVHRFQFYYDDKHFEITIDSLEIQAQYRDDYTVFFENSEFPVIIDKPVIYLYPEKTTNISLELETKGELKFTYPVYTNGWRFIADKDGTLHFGEAEYTYLFWESEQQLKLSAEDFESGFIVEKEKVVSFLEEKLSKAGLTSKEQADFITYWAPRLMQNNTNFVHFIFDEKCDRFASLNITPKPDQVHRVYIVWSKLNSSFNQTVIEQTIPVFKREGFTVIEWGGSQIYPAEFVN